MAKCDVCGKGALFGRQISITRSQVSGRANREWKSNVKSVKVKVNGGTKKMHVCTSCLRSGKVERA
ncbi:MAG: 50S ribosomal protein L28 [Lachnospiraceae bacterium]